MKRSKREMKKHKKIREEKKREKRREEKKRRKTQQNKVRNKKIKKKNYQPALHVTPASETRDMLGAN